jgi:HK97 family phage portal protein
MGKSRTLQRLRRRLDARREETRSSVSVDGTGEFTGAFTLPTLAGSTVNHHTALTIAAVYQAVNVYANTIAGLDLYLMKRHEKGGHSPAFSHRNFDMLHCRPNPVMTSFTFRQTITGHAVTQGNGYAAIERSDGDPRRLHLQDPQNVRPEVHDDGTLWYHRIREHDDIPARDMVHFHGLGYDGLKGYSPITVARETFGLAMAQEKWQSALMGNSATPNGILEYPGTLKQDAKDRLLDEFNRRHQGSDRAGNVAVFTGGLKWVQTSFSPADAELILGRGFTVAEVARIFNLPQHMLGMLEHATFSNIEEQNRQFYQLSLMPWLRMMEQELDVKLFTRAERKVYFVRFDVKTLLRGDSEAQTKQDESDFEHGFKSINEIRLSRGDNPIDDPAADKHFIPVNNMSALEDLMGEPATKGAPAPAVEPARAEVGPIDDADVQSLALNGAQIASLLDIVRQVAEGTLPVESAKGTIAASFPALSDSQIEAILAPLSGFTPAPDPTATPAAKNALRALVADPVRRMGRRAASAAKKAANKGDLPAWIDAFFGPTSREQFLFAEAVKPAVDAVRALGVEAPSPVDVAALVSRQIAGRLRELVTTHSPDELPGAVDRALGSLLEHNAESIAEVVIP